MAALERLTVDQIRAEDLLAAHHVHRYAWAAQLCEGARVLDLACGVGYGSEILMRSATSVTAVDRDPGALAEGRRHFGELGISFQLADAGEHIRLPLHEQHDVLVCFEGLEHFDELPEIFDQLRHHARKGLKLLVSLPNEDKFVEDNHFHVQTFTYRDVQELAASMPDAVVLQQFLAEGSLISAVGAEPPHQAASEVVNRERFEPVFANHWLIAVGFGAHALEVASGRLNVATSPNYNSYMIALERANAELRRINTELMQEHLGVRDAAAAGRALAMEGLQERYEELQERLAAPRYRAMDSVRDRALRVPGVSVTWWNIRRATRAARSSPARRMR